MHLRRVGTGRVLIICICEPSVYDHRMFTTRTDNDSLARQRELFMGPGESCPLLNNSDRHRQSVVDVNFRKCFSPDSRPSRKNGQRVTL